MERFLTKEDICTHLGDDYERFHGAIVPPIYQNSLFTRKTKEHGYVYTRIGNPTVEIAEKKLAALEEGEQALCFGSGMAAISTAILSVVNQGSHVVCVRNAYGPTQEYLAYMAKFGIETTYVSGENPDDFERAIRPETDLIYLESPSTYLFSLQDLSAVAELAKHHGITTMVDNSWATPLHQNPLRYGIDLVLHSASKYLGGHSDIIGGVLVGSSERLAPMIHRERALAGGVIDPHQAWLLIRGLRTLPVRMRGHGESAMHIAHFLEAHPLVERVIYPALPSHPQHALALRQMSGFSGLFGFVPRGSDEKIMAFVRSLQVFEYGPSWGGFESLVTTPGVGVDAQTCSLLGIPKGLVRISVGLESPESLTADLDQALCRMNA